MLTSLFWSYSWFVAMLFTYSPHHFSFLCLILLTSVFVLFCCCDQIGFILSVLLHLYCTEQRSSKAGATEEDYLADLVSICHQSEGKSQPEVRQDRWSDRIRWQCEGFTNSTALIKKQTRSSYLDYVLILYIYDPAFADWVFLIGVRAPVRLVLTWLVNQTQTGLFRLQQSVWCPIVVWLYCEHETKKVKASSPLSFPLLSPKPLPLPYCSLSALFLNFLSLPPSPHYRHLPSLSPIAVLLLTVK